MTKKRRKDKKHTGIIALPSRIYRSVDLYESNSYVTVETDELRSEAKKDRRKEHN